MRACLEPSVYCGYLWPLSRQCLDSLLVSDNNLFQPGQPSSPQADSRYIKSENIEPSSCFTSSNKWFSHNGLKFRNDVTRE